MKKPVKIILVSLFLFFLISGIGGFIFLKTFDANRLKPQITSAVQNALGRSIDFARIDLGLSLKKGVQLRITDILIGEHPDFGKDSFLSAKEINLAVSLKDLILKRQIRVLGVSCNSPKLNIIRLRDGRINIQAFQTSEKPPARNIPPPVAAVPVVFINSINIENARLVYIDYFLDPKVSLIFDKIMLKIEKFSLTEWFPIALQAGFASDSRNIFAEGKGKVNMDKPSFLLQDIKVTTDISVLSLDALRGFLPQLEGIPLPEIKSGALSISVDIFEAGQQGLIALKGQGALNKGSLRIKELAVPIEPIEADASMSESVITLSKASFNLGQGRVELSGNISDYLLKQDYSIKAMLNEIDLNACLEQSAYPVKIKGLISGNVDLKGQGFDPSTLISKLSGKSSLEIKEGQLTDINLLKMVLDKLSFVPNLAAALETGMPERFKESLRKKDTVITGFKAQLDIGNSVIAIQSMDMDAQAFSFRGSGRVNFDQAYAFDGSFTIPQELSSRMIQAVPEMEYLSDELKQIRFPLKVSGKGALVSFMPDVKQIGVSAIKQRGRQELERVLDRVFRQESPDADGAQTDSTSAEQLQPGPDKESSKKKLIDTVIGTIFKEPAKE